MASISESDAARFSITAIPGRYYLDQRPTDQLFQLLPFIGIEGHELRVPLASSDQADAVPAGGALGSAMPTITDKVFKIKRISAELPVDSVVTSLYSSYNDITAALTELKSNALRDHFKLLLARGDETTNPEEFDGLLTLANTYGIPLTTLGAGMIEEMLEVLQPRKTTRDVYLVMHALAFTFLVKNFYGDVEYRQHPVLGTVPAIAGVTVLIDNFLPLDEGAMNDETSIYMVRLGKDVGLCGIYPAAHGDAPIQVRGPVVKDGTDTLYYHLSWDVGLACYNPGAIVRQSQVPYGA